MKPVMQTVSGLDGNCYAACLASIMELRIEDVPDLWDRELSQWAEMLGWDLFVAGGDGLPIAAERSNGPKNYGIASVQVGSSIMNWSIARLAFTASPARAAMISGGNIHAVVCLDGKIVHDPSPLKFGRPDCPVVLWTMLRKL